MQLPSEAPALVDHDESGRRGGKAPVSPSSPESPSKGNSAAAREKPVKVLPCPRCESLNTKFCYYNNYSVAQPRHFCRQCQRYWTAGGTLRNVPVGGGSRKKNRHPRALNEPYLHRGSPPNSFGASPQLMQPGGHFQQMLTQDNMAGFAPQFPGFGFPNHPYGSMDPAAVESMQQQQHHQQHHQQQQQQQQQHQHGVMYGTAPHTQHHVMPYYYQTQDAACPSPFPNDGTVKSEFWQPAQMAAPLPNNKRFESTMSYNLGHHNRPQNNNNNNKPLWDQSSADVKPTVEGAPVITTKNASPPHGSSTIEEEGSTPTNRYSTSGYEEGDAVSSMWPNLPDVEHFFSS